MALLFMDGFDHYATADMAKKWTSVTNVTINATGGRRNGGYMSPLSGSMVLSKTLPSSYSTLTTGFAFWRSVTVSQGSIVTFYESATAHLGVKLVTGNFLAVYRGSTLLATGTTPLSASTWYYIEFKGTVHDSTGSYTLRINGNTELTASNVDTRNAGTSGLVNILNLGIDNTNNYGGGFDDFYILDSSGSAPLNDFLGDVRIDTVYPSSDGTYTDFTPSTGVSHFALVDEATPNTSDYNQSSTAGQRDSYGLQDLTALTAQTIYGVQVNAAATKDDAGARSLATFIRHGDTNADAAAVALPTSQTYISNVFPTNPSTGAAWTEAQVNAMEAGVIVS